MTIDTFKKGDLFEKQVLGLIRSLIDADNFFVSKSNCKIFHKKNYYSKDREKDIVFDIAVEIYLPQSTEYSMLILIECKDYASAIPVDDIEEFYVKTQQVASSNSKAIVVCTSKFQESALTFARSKGMGLARYVESKNLNWILHRSPSLQTSTGEDTSFIRMGLTSEKLNNHGFDLFIQTPKNLTNSLRKLFIDLIVSQTSEKLVFKSIINAKRNKAINIPFLKPEQIDDKANEILNDACYVSGAVNLNTLCEIEAINHNLKITKYDKSESINNEDNLLGKISFTPLIIEIFSQNHTTEARERFTLAHELSHHYLRHGQFLHEENLRLNTVHADSDTVHVEQIRHLEFQANALAASILLPKINLIKDFLKLLHKHKLINRGHGILFIDNQPCNSNTYFAITDELMATYKVSREVVYIRLKNLNLLKDQRANHIFKMSDIFKNNTNLFKERNP